MLFRSGESVKESVSGNSADKHSGKKEKQKKLENEKKSEAPKKSAGKAAKTASTEKNIPKKDDTYEAYGIGQQLPTYLL